MKELILISGLFPNEIRQQIIHSSSRNIQFAADALQWSIVKGLKELNTKFKVINTPFIGGFPTLSNIIRVPSFPFGDEHIMYGTNLGYFNLNLIKNYLIEKKLFKYLSNYIQKKKRVC